MKQKKINNYEKILLFIFMFLPILVISWNLDNDTWFLLNHGRYIWQNGIPHIEPFTIHTDMQFVMQQWLFSTLLWVMYDKIGRIALILGVYFLSILFSFFMYRLCMYLSKQKFYLSVVLTTYASFVIYLWFAVPRPQVVTYMLILLEMFCLEKYVNNQKWRNLLALPLISILQINLHASMWFLLFAFTLPYLINAFKFKIGQFESGGYRKLPLVTVFVTMFAVGFINPYGFSAITYIFRSFGKSLIDRHVNEMAVPDIRTIPGLVFYFTLFVIVMVYMCNKEGNFTVRHFLLLLGTTFLALRSQKSIPFFIMGSFLPMAANLSNQAEKLRFGCEDEHKNKIQMVGVACFLALIIGLAVNIRIEKYNISDDYPVTKKAIDYLAKQEKEKIKVYTGYSDGCYAEYKGVKVYIDARAEVFLKENNLKKDIFEEYISLRSGEIHYKDFLKRYDFTHILVRKSELLNTYLEEDDDYQVVYKDKNCRIYVPVNK